jgi:hypothetical protein
MSLWKAPMSLWILEKENSVIVNQNKPAGGLHNLGIRWGHERSTGIWVKTLLIDMTKSTFE